MSGSWKPSPVTRIVIVGAGIVGAALADQLAARRGGDVVLIDRSSPGVGTSRTSFGWLNANKKQPRAYFDLSVEGMRDWSRLARGFGEPCWYHPVGNLAWARSPQAREELAERVDRLQTWGYGAEIVTASRARVLEPNVTIPPDAEIAFFPDEGYVCGGQAAQALVQRATSRGARLITDAEVSELVVSQDRVTGVRLANEERIAAETVVCCAGWRSPKLLAPVGIDLALTEFTPGSATRGLTATIDGITPRPDRVIHAPELHLRPRGESRLLLEAADIDDQVDVTSENGQLDRAQELLARAGMLVPGAVSATIVEASLCVRPLPLDGYPLVGPVSDHHGVYIAVTHSGITLAATLARHVALELLGTESSILRHYRPDRTLREAEEPTSNMKKAR
ncbi:MAG: FAD-binding oxidoreductase [Actinobacteria bacterium]|nr:FAD-binding oxidoreductase [Actinomycetota bacterium]